ncbi:MAG TPA: M15 family metallopeptidase, partial [Candidatus Dojkabacteria bacterium]|nr:M15 family metallopeptidase [Candidatus Dojkabacteria bacterium]
MKKVLILLIFLILILSIPKKTAELTINWDTDYKDKKIYQWVENPQEIIDTSTIVQIQKKEENSIKWWEYPSTIYPTKRNGDDLLVLVNKQYKLPSSYAPKDLVKASKSGIRRGENYYLRNIVIPDLTRMITDAKSEGVDLSIVSGYRSYQTQIDTYNYWLRMNNGNTSLVDTFSARAGHSQHQLGTVIDFSTNEIRDKLGDEFSNTKASKWLSQHAYKYGFVISYPKGFENITGYKHESWHYRYIGVENAQNMINLGKILELYLRDYNL